MFAPRYFAPRYFAPRYFAGTVATTPPDTGSAGAIQFVAPFGWTHFFLVAGVAVDLPPTLEKAIVLRFRADARSAFVDGGLSYGDVADSFAKDDHRLYKVFLENGGISRKFTTGDGTQVDDLGKRIGSPTKSVEYRFFGHGPTAYDGRRMRDLVEDLFCPRSPALEWTRGVTSNMVPQDEGQDPSTYVDSRGKKVYLSWIDVRFTFDRYPLS